MNRSFVNVGRPVGTIVLSKNVVSLRKHIFKLLSANGSKSQVWKWSLVLSAILRLSQSLIRPCPYRKDIQGGCLALWGHKCILSKHSSMSFTSSPRFIVDLRALHAILCKSNPRLISIFDTLKKVHLMGYTSCNASGYPRTAWLTFHNGIFN